MMGNFNYKGYAMEYGTFVGLSWSALFLSYVYGICRDNALLILACSGLLGFSFVLPFLLGIRINKILHSEGIKLTYFLGLGFSLSMFMHACFLNGLIVYGYFSLFDNGAIVATLTNMLQDPTIQDTYKAIGLGNQYSQLMDMMGELDALSSFDKTLMLFNNNFIWSMILSFLVALFVSYKRKNTIK